MMDDKKKPVVPPQEKIEELQDEQLNEVNGGITIPTIPGNEKLGGLKPGGLKLGQALKNNTSLTKSDDRLP